MRSLLRFIVVPCDYLWVLVLLALFRCCSCAFCSGLGTCGGFLLVCIMIFVVVNCTSSGQCHTAWPPSGPRQHLSGVARVEPADVPRDLAPALALGDRVELFGLRAATELNGRLGTVVTLLEETARVGGSPPRPCGYQGGSARQPPQGYGGCFRG